MTDNRSVTRFFQTKVIPPTLWSACDYVLQFNFHVMHVAGTQNTAADFLSRIDFNPKEKVELKIRNDITIQPIQVNLQSTDVADEEQLFFLPEETIETEEEILLQKEQARQNARDEETTKIKLSIKETTPIPINKASYTFGAIKEDARIRVEQDTDLVFKAIKRKLICEEYDKHLLQTDPKAKRLLVHENRLIVKDGVLMRKYYGECGQVTHNQILIPEHLITELLKAIHGQMGKHPGITKMIQECRSKYYYPGLAKRIRQWVMQCEDCIKNKRINNSQIRPKMINNTTRIGTRRYTRNRHTAKPTKLCRIPEHCHNDRCVLTLPIRIPDAECHCENNRTMHCRRHDQTCISANFNFVRQRLTIQIRSRRRNNANP